MSADDLGMLTRILELEAANVHLSARESRAMWRAEEAERRVVELEKQLAELAAPVKP